MLYAVPDPYPPIPPRFGSNLVPSNIVMVCGPLLWLKQALSAEASTCEGETSVYFVNSPRLVELRFGTAPKAVIPAAVGVHRKYELLCPVVCRSKLPK